MSRRDLLSLAGLAAAEIGGLIDRAKHYKTEPLTVKESSLLQGVAIGLLFEKPSTRTRVSFEVAIHRLGGRPLFLSQNDLQIKRGETIADTARVLGGYLGGLVIRTFRHAQLEEWAAASPIPIINGLSDRYHPCQILADLLTISEHRGRMAGLNLVFIGDGNNVAHSLMIGGAKMGMNVTVASPRGFMPNTDIVKRAMEFAKESGSKIVVTNDPVHAAIDADILYADTWVSMGDDAEEAQRNQQFQPYQLNQQMVEKARPDLLVMHCLPAHRGEEITDEVMDGRHSVIFQQSANRLPMHQAILEWALYAARD
jgi:ornithine carbamoyltransferase